MWGCRPNSNYLLSSVASQDTTTCQSNAKTYAHAASTSTQFHSGMGTQTQTDCACIFLSLKPSSFRVPPNNLASHAHVILPSHINCTSAFQDINTIKNVVACIHSSRCLVKAKVNSFEHKQLRGGVLVGERWGIHIWTTLREEQTQDGVNPWTDHSKQPFRSWLHSTAGTVS